MKDQRTEINISKFLPHHAPMLMADRLLVIEEDFAEGDFLVKPDCIFVENKILSETGLLEHAAQVSSAIVGKNFFLQDDLEGESNKVVGYISTIKKLKIYNHPKIHQHLVTKANLISRIDAEDFSTCSIHAKSFYNDELLLDGMFNFLIHEI